jgi:peptide/nickel transport system substrate-binding protein
VKKRTLLIAATVALALVLAGAVSGQRAKSGGVFRLGTSSRIDSLNPYVAFNQDAYSMFEYIYPFLVQYNEKTLKFAPDFAASWMTSKGGKVWTFRTRANARWSDGQPLTAADAAWTINTDIKYQSTGAANTAGLIAHIVRAEAPNPTTLVVRYKEAAGNVLGQFQQFAILPQHVWSTYTGHKGNDLKTFPNDAPVVSGGPFTLTRYTKDEIALFERNAGYYGAKPIADGFGLRMYANDDAMISALKHNELDAVEQVPPTAIKTLRTAGFAVNGVPGLKEMDFINNSNPKKTRHRELLDLKVREALAHAIDRKQIVNVVYLGHARPAASFIPPSSGAWSNASLKPETFDLPLANKILDGLGYKKGADGIRVAGDHKMAYEVIDPTDVQPIPRTFQIIQTAFAKIGVRLTLKPLDSSAAFDAVTAPNTKYLNFDFAMWDWTALIDPDFMLSVLTCAQYGGWSDTGYCNPAYDKLYAKQQLTPNQNKRRAIVWAMQKKQVAERPYTMLVYLDWVDAVSKKWEGLSVTPQGPFNSLSKQSLTKVHQIG